jgi:hypothetical protein
VQEGAFFRVKYNNDPIFASFDTAPSPHRRINAPSLLLAFAHIEGEAGTPTGGRRECGGGCNFLHETGLGLAP